MTRAGLRFIMTCSAAALLAAAPAAAQTGWHTRALLGGENGAQAGRTIDLDTQAASRYAIVIGNSDYSAIPDLANAQSDASAMASFLEAQGYDVRHHEDLTKRGFEQVLRRALFDITRDTEVVFFFAGHGFQIGSENYIVPVDADLDSAYDVPFEAVSLGSLVSIIGARARLQLVILDSCRDNPFAGKTALASLGNELRETRTGFASLAAPLNSMLVYSTSPGAVAYDGEGENSPFTRALIESASEDPDRSVKEIFERVRRSVYQETAGLQVPWESSTLVEPMSFGLASWDGRLAAAPAAGSGTGGTRGLALLIPGVSGGDSATTSEASDGPPPSAVIEVPFDGDVEIGPVLVDALGVGAADKVRITEEPRTGRLVAEASQGLTQNAAGRELASTELQKVAFANQSVQIAAPKLSDGTIRDRLTVEVNGNARAVELALVPDQCDYHAGDHLDPDGMGITRYANEIRPEQALAACEAAIEEQPNVGRFQYQKGRALLALRRFDEAMLAFERARDLGHARAWNALGNAIMNLERRTGGEGEVRAPEEALKLFARGVEEGDPYAFYSLGRQFMKFGTSPDQEIEGYDLMMRSLEVGHTFAMNELGFFYLDEDSRYFDPERGLRYLKESAAREDIYGYNNMGLVYLQGLAGQEKDYAEALKYFLAAADGGHPNAPANLGYMYREGLAAGGAAEAVRWYAEGLERGDAFAGGNAAYIVGTQQPAGYDMMDGAILAAKSAALENHPSSGEARDLLGQFPRAAVDAGTQQLMADLGIEVSVDGQFGPGSRAAMEALLERYDLGTSVSDDPIQRIIQLADIHWEQSPFRVDLY